MKSEKFYYTCAASIEAAREVSRWAESVRKRGQKVYVGVTARPYKRIVLEHRADPHRTPVYLMKLRSDGVARRAEKMLQGVGHLGAPGGGGRDARFLYAYVVTRNTREHR